MSDDIEKLTLRADLASVLIECQNERPEMFGPSLTHAELRKLADVLAEKLRPRIGGRYVPKNADRDGLAMRNAAVCEAFTGRNHEQVMRQFNISRRHLYAILAQGRKQRLGSKP